MKRVGFLLSLSTTCFSVRRAQLFGYFLFSIFSYPALSLCSSVVNLKAQWKFTVYHPGFINNPHSLPFLAVLSSSLHTHSAFFFFPSWLPHTTQHFLFILAFCECAPLSSFNSSRFHFEPLCVLSVVPFRTMEPSPDWAAGGGAGGAGLTDSPIRDWLLSLCPAYKKIGGNSERRSNGNEVERGDQKGGNFGKFEEKIFWQEALN